MNKHKFIIKGVTALLIAIAQVTLANDNTFSTVDQLYMGAIANASQSISNHEQLNTLCMSEPNDYQAILQASQACIWSARLHTKTKLKKQDHYQAQQLLSLLANAEDTLPHTSRLNAQLLMDQMGYRSFVFQVSHGNQLGSLTAKAIATQPENKRSQLLRSLFMVNAPKIAGGNTAKALSDLNQLSLSNIDVVRLDALFELCRHANQKVTKTEIMQCQQHVVASFENKESL